MKLLKNITIAQEKLTKYLLVLRKRNLSLCTPIKGNNKMSYELFEEVVLTKDVPEKVLKKAVKALEKLTAD